MIEFYLFLVIFFFSSLQFAAAAPKTKQDVDDQSRRSLSAGLGGLCRREEAEQPC